MSNRFFWCFWNAICKNMSGKNTACRYGKPHCYYVIPPPHTNIIFACSQISWIELNEAEVKMTQRFLHMTRISWQLYIVLQIYIDTYAIHYMYTHGRWSVHVDGCDIYYYIWPKIRSSAQKFTPKVPFCGSRKFRVTNI